MKTYSIQSAKTGLFASDIKQLGLAESWQGPEQAAQLTFEEAARVCRNLNSLVPNGAIMVENPSPNTIENTLEQEILSFANEAQDVSQGIFDSAMSLAEHLEAGTISESEAREQLDELRSDLDEARED